MFGGANNATGGSLFGSNTKPAFGNTTLGGTSGFGTSTGFGEFSKYVAPVHVTSMDRMQGWDQPFQMFECRYFQAAFKKC